MIGRSILAYAFFPLLEAQPIDQARVALFEMPKLRPCKANFFIGHFEESVVRNVFLHSFSKTSKLGLRICELIKVS